MMKITDYIQYIMGIIGGFVGWFFGGFDLAIILLIVFIVIDYISGVASAYVNKTLSSSVGFKGIVKKILIFLLVGMGHILDITVLGEGEMIRTAVIFFYVANEGLSILENCASLSLPIPEVLKKALAKITEQNDPESEIEKDEDNQ
ncbi:MAG: phage holin family protein [Clostridiales bacterium]|nr:phage holin family protein [Clostridiales bacterium]